MKKHYCKPESVIQDILLESMLATSESREEYVPIVPNPGTPAANSRRDTWGNLWGE